MSAEAADGATLHRSLGYWDLVLYGLAYIAPFAPLTTLGFVWNESNGLIVLAYALGGVCMYFTARSYAMMTEVLPSAGSVYGFARHSLGKFPGFMAGWMILLDYLLIPAFVYVLVAVALQTLIPGVDRGVWIILLAVVTTSVNWFGISVTARANFIAVALQVLVLVGFVILALIALYSGKGNGALTLKPLFDPATFNAGRVFGATSICVMSFLGFDAVSTLAEEVKGGDRHVVGRAIIAVLMLSAAFFVAVTWVLGNLLPGIVIKDSAAATYELAAWATGPWTAVVLAWTNAVIVGLSNALPMQVGVARVVFAMGRDRQMPRAFARVHPRYRTPYVGMLVTSRDLARRGTGYGEPARRSGVDRELRGAERIPASPCLRAGQICHQTALAPDRRPLDRADLRILGRARGFFGDERTGGQGRHDLASGGIDLRSRFEGPAPGGAACAFVRLFPGERGSGSVCRNIPTLRCGNRGGQSVAKKQPLHRLWGPIHPISAVRESE